MNREKKIFLILITLFILVIGLYGFYIAGNENSVEFPDKNLEAVIREEINRPKGRLTSNHLESILVLNAEYRNIRSLDGIRNLRNLRELNLRGNHIDNIHQLKHLKRLEVLNLRENRIDNIEAISSLIQLRRLNLRDNSIEDIQALTKLTDLEDIDLRFNNISDISPILEMDSLKTRLYLIGNPIRNFYKLASIYNTIQDIDFERHIYDPIYNKLGGFYYTSFYLQINKSIDGGEIFYTLDGSEPDPIHNKKNTHLYTGKLYITSRAGEENTISMIPTNHPNERNTWQPPYGEVFKATVVRSGVFYDNKLRSNIVTHTYIIDESGHQRFSMPVISIATNADNFFHNETGIYVPGLRYIEEHENSLITGNYFGRGIEWEKPISIEFFETDGSLAFSQNAGVRIHGGTSRMEPQKALRIYARTEYNNNYIRHTIFGENSSNRFKRILLRTSGNEWGNTMFLDALAHTIMKDMRPDVQLSRPAIVFINGEYWGIHNVRERFDRWYLSENYGIPEDQVVILMNNAEINEGIEGDQEHYLQMIRFIERNNLSGERNFNHIKTFMDIENYIEYQLAQIYYANIDWPQNNIKFWRRRTDGFDAEAPYGHDGRWRWMVFDLDCSFGFWGTSAETRSLHMASDPDYNHNGIWGGEWQWSTFLFRSLLENISFRNQFINTFADHLNTTFREERVLRMIDDFENLYKPQMNEHINRWRAPSSMEEWRSNIDNMREFAANRPFHVRQHILEKFQLEGLAYVTVSAPEDWEGEIQINSIRIDSSQLPWRGIYFKGLPIEISAQSDEFNGWRGDISSSQRTVSINLNRDIHIIIN